MARLLTIAFWLFLTQPIYAQSESGHSLAGLSSQEKQILAPLAKDWNRMDPAKKQKWLGITKRYPDMTPLEQQRIQTHIRDWDSLTPDQRKQARKKYQKIKNLPPEKRLHIK